MWKSAAAISSSIVLYLTSGVRSTTAMLYSSSSSYPVVSTINSSVGPLNSFYKCHAEVNRLNGFGDRTNAAGQGPPSSSCSTAGHANPSNYNQVATRNWNPLPCPPDTMDCSLPPVQHHPDLRSSSCALLLIHLPTFVTPFSCDRKRLTNKRFACMRSGYHSIPRKPIGRNYTQTARELTTVFYHMRGLKRQSPWIRQSDRATVITKALECEPTLLSDRHGLASRFTITKIAVKLKMVNKWEAESPLWPMFLVAPSSWPAPREWEKQ